MTPLSDVPQIVQVLACGAVIRTDGGRDHDPPDYILDSGSPRVLDTTIVNMIHDGWLESFNGGYRLTDAGRASYMRSTDELGNGVLVAPNNQESVK
jgi:hypothetical protein